MSDQITDTKMKIMNAARDLFAAQGFEGTSIRDIASAAEVNIASVNYHFSNKDNLILEVLRQGYAECSADFRRWYEESDRNLEETLICFWRQMQERSADLISHFKMMMSTQHNHKLLAQGTEDEFIGPPGGKVVCEALIKEVKGDIADVDLYWGLRTLFSHVVHMSLMHSCCFKENTVPFSSPAEIEKGIRRLTRVVIRELSSKN
jgi:AcrR family transcriptional regulator